MLVRQSISTVSCLAQCPRHTRSETAARSSQDAGHASRRWAQFQDAQSLYQCTVVDDCVLRSIHVTISPRHSRPDHAIRGYNLATLWEVYKDSQLSGSIGASSSGTTATTISQQPCQLSTSNPRIPTNTLLLGMMRRPLHCIVTGRKMRRPRRSGSERARINRLKRMSTNTNPLYRLDFIIMPLLTLGFFCLRKSNINVHL